MRSVRIFLVGACLQLTQAQGPHPKVELNPVGETLGVDISIEGMTGNLSITLPEVINDATRRMVYVDTNLRRVEWRKLPNGGLTHTWREPGTASYEITATPEPGSINIDWRMQNLSKAPWPDAAGNICMRSGGVQELFNPETDRIFLREKGRWRSVKEVGPGPGNRWYLPPGVPILPLMKPHLEEINGWRISDFHPDEAIIAVQSRDGSVTVAQAWARARYILSNLKGKYVCTEVSPAFGDIAPGQTLRSQGRIYIVRGGLDELAGRYKQDVARGRIATKTVATGRQ